MIMAYYQADCVSTPRFKKMRTLVILFLAIFEVCDCFTDYLKEKFYFKEDEKLKLLNFSSIVRNQMFGQNGGYKKADDPLTRVGFRFEIARLEKFDEITGELKLLSSVFMFWSDKRLTWDASTIEIPQERSGYSYTITYLQMKLEEIWRPDIRLFNPLDEMDIFKDKGNDVALLGSIGILFYDGLVKTDTSCQPNLENFPFDEHECFVQFVVTSTLIANMPNKTTVFYDNAKWIYFQMQPCDLDLAPSRYGDEHKNERRVLVFPIKFIRRPTYLFLNIAVPLFVLSLLNTVVYFIPAVPEDRLSFCVALLLSFTVYLIYVAGLIPETSNPVPLIIYFLVFQFLFSTFITCSSFLTAMLNQRDETKPIPSIIKGITNVFHKRLQRKIGQNSETKARSNNDMVEDSTCTEQRTPVVKDDVVETSHVFSIDISWKDVASLVEKVCLIVTVVVLLLEVLLFIYLATKLSINVESTVNSEICRTNPLNSTSICLDDVSGLCIDPLTDIPN
uniref:Neuronal acetylcholine receptor subunit alpha-3-like n=1 Tax=Crassostrea virginica TaxID=6565 RepID=A0A8B8F1Z7_CRAVI|nr:neuronal acetylcholine receptor subunit alpha-3-like [Crassostrea virginica]